MVFVIAQTDKAAASFSHFFPSSFFARNCAVDVRVSC